MNWQNHHSLAGVLLRGEICHLTLNSKKLFVNDCLKLNDPGSCHSLYRKNSAWQDSLLQARFLHFCKKTEYDQDSTPMVTGPVPPPPPASHQPSPLSSGPNSGGSGVSSSVTPPEARHHLASWIESSFREDLEVGNPQHEEHARRLVLSIIHQLEIKSSEKNIKRRYIHNPIYLYQIIRQCLHTEMTLIQKAEMRDGGVVHGGSGGGNGGSSTSQHPGLPNNNNNNEAMYQVQHQLNTLKKLTQDTGIEIEKIRQMQEHHSINYYKHHQLSVQLDSGRFPESSQEYVQWKEWRDKVAEELRQSFNNLKLQMSNLANHHLDMIKQLKELQYRIIDQELNKWKRDQQLSGNGAHFGNNLDTIQKWCEDFAEILWMNRQQIRQLEMIQEGLNLPSHDLTMNILPELSEGLALLIDSLVKSSFIIEKQPPQVLKTNTRFSATVRLLVGTKMNIHMSPPLVTVSIISEAQANSLLRAGTSKKSKSEYSSGEILNNKQTMEYHQATGQLTVSFRNMSLKKIKRAEKKGTESVMDEKFALLFWSEFSIGNGEFPLQVCAPSLPVVVIVHGNQEPHAWATILWDNAFAEWGRQPFIVPDKVPWCQVATTLNMKFKSSCGRILTEDNLRLLASKCFRSHGYNQDFSNALVSWSQFCKEPLPDRSFTFWDWFHAIMKLTKEDLRGLWIDGALMGFISRHEAEDFLHKSQNGTFLIRFSDSELGGVTVAWITVNEQTGDREVAMLQPFTRKDLIIPFGKYYTIQNEAAAPRINLRNNGYVPHHLVNVIHGMDDEDMRSLHVG
ncbi:STAT5B [Lepeophtheirus salmonis]|uniref:Signal transducer and activator of transcription n=1 Tax=Lepeophtheirus salmonis TaxID=72036 RepID=A0A7R8CXT2_LEPSM|nr:STAT5B [Lepeophtheirus salmonis]CAF2964916.1 STAT5B [Lepeophtheirus salmonis]